mmetsp:Transcript_56411/g.104405  ORF Transcript_56411/g.104405 Transcript_56411/m.104405 type:complete len:244 (-) Transcript_56411:45-776(-)
MRKWSRWAWPHAIILIVTCVPCTAVRSEVEVTTDAAGYVDELLAGGGADVEHSGAATLASSSAFAAAPASAKATQTVGLSEASSPGLAASKGASDAERMTKERKTPILQRVLERPPALLQMLAGGLVAEAGLTASSVQPNASAFDPEKLLQALPLGGECGSIDQDWGVPAPYNYGLGCNTGRCQCSNALFYGCATSNRMFPIEGRIGQVVAELGYCRLQLAVYIIPALIVACVAGFGVRQVVK